MPKMHLILIANIKINEIYERTIINRGEAIY